MGSAIVLDGKPYTVVGILPPDFRLPYRERLTAAVDAFVPLRVNVGWIGDHNNEAIGRLRPGVSLEKAQAELDILQAQVSAIAGKEALEPVTLAASLTPLTEHVVGTSRRGLLVLMAAILAVLLIRMLQPRKPVADANDRPAPRGGDSVGARREPRPAHRQNGARAVPAVARRRVARHLGGLDGARRVRANRAGRSAARSRGRARRTRSRLRGGGVDPHEPARGGLPRVPNCRPRRSGGVAGPTTSVAGDRGGLRRHAMLLALQVGVSVILLVVTGLLTLSFVRVLTVDRGFIAKRVLAVDMALPATRYADESCGSPSTTACSRQSTRCLGSSRRRRRCCRFEGRDR